MAHFAEIDDSGVVLRVLVVSDKNCQDSDGNEQESVGVSFLQNLLDGGTWVQVSYNGRIRNMYPGVGDTYRSDLDAFIPRQPFESWTFDEDILQWLPPVEEPEGGRHTWNEVDQIWVDM